jgi:hypothetical protein
MRRALLLIAMSASASASIRSPIHLVRAGDDLQAAINAARAGDELRLAAGATFTGNFVLPVFDGDTPVTIRTDLPDAQLPAANQRVTPAAAAHFARIVSPNASPAIRTAPAAHDWRLTFLEFPATRNGAGDIIAIGDGSAAQSQPAQVPSEIVLDHVYIHGDAAAGQKRGVAANGRAVTVRNSYISDIKGIGVDTQAIAAWNGPGPFLIENNYLEAAGEVVLFGGADPAIQDLVPSDIVVRFNHLSRPMDWRGSKWQVKNVFELKNARRVTVENNVFENNWLAAQPGYAILFTPRNQDGKCPWCVVEEVRFAHNVVRHSSAGLSISGFDSPNPSRQTNAIRVEDNLFYGITTKLGGNGWAVLIGDGPRDLVFDHNTFEFDGTTLLYAYGGKATPKPIEGFRFTSNAARLGEYGINGADSSSGKPALERFFPGAVVSGNWLSGGSASKYPAGNRFESPFDSGIAAGARPPAAAAATIGARVGALLKMADNVTNGVIERP